MSKGIHQLGDFHDFGNASFTLYHCHMEMTNTARGEPCPSPFPIIMEKCLDDSQSRMVFIAYRGTLFFLQRVNKQHLQAYELFIQKEVYRSLTEGLSKDTVLSKFSLQNYSSCNIIRTLPY